MFNRIRELIEAAINNGYEPLAYSARELAEDIVESTGEFDDYSIEDVTASVEQVKAYFEGRKDE
jgi:predicted alpha/beta hydrolase